jgi:hypothetical protein
MLDKANKEVNVGDILFAVKGTSLKYYLIVRLKDYMAICQEVDNDFNIIEQPRGRKFRELNISDCFLHSKKENDKYIKVL